VALEFDGFGDGTEEFADPIDFAFVVPFEIEPDGFEDQSYVGGRVLYVSGQPFEAAA
jgi:hypothetical protein